MVNIKDTKESRVAMKAQCIWIVRVLVLLILLPVGAGYGQTTEKKVTKDTDATTFMLKSDTTIYTLNGKSMTLEELKRSNPKAIYDLETKVYQEMFNLMRQQYFTTYFEKLAKKSGKSVTEVQDEYFAKKLKENSKLLDQRVEDFLKNNSNHPDLASKSKKEQKKMVRDSFEGQVRQQSVSDFMDDAMRSGQMVFMLPLPKLPAIQFTMHEDEYTRYGEKPEDEGKSFGCQGDQCPVTIIEYSGFQCPACASIIPITSKIMKKNKGKVRWIVRDFPFSHHRRSRPAAIAAGCAYEQGKYWQMYHALFKNQSDLSDKSFVMHAKKLGIYNNKFKDCQAKPEKVGERVDRNLASATKHGMNSTPSFYVNGRYLQVRSGDDFQAAIDRELAEAKQASK